MSIKINDIFNFKGEYKPLIKQIEKVKPSYDELVSQQCTHFLKNYNDCVETKKKQLTKSHSKSIFFWKSKEITEDTNLLIDYDSKVLCKEKYYELSECLNQMYMSSFSPLMSKGDERKFRERFYLFLKYNYIKDLK